MALAFDRSTIATEPPITVWLQRSTPFTGYDSSDFRWQAWVADSAGNPTGSAVYDTSSGDAAADGAVVWDSSTQTLTWTLPTDTLQTARTLVGFFTLDVDGQGTAVRVFPQPRSGSAIYITIHVVRMGAS